MLLPILIQAASLGLAAAAAPGPLQTYLITETLRGGWKRGAAVAFAPLLSDAPIVLLVLFLLNQIPAWLLDLIRIGGGLLALFLAWGIARQLRVGVTADLEHTQSQSYSLRTGALINLLSPGPYLFWSLLNGPLLLSAWREAPLFGISFLLTFYGVFLSSLMGLAAIFHQSRKLGPQVVRGLLLLSLLILLIFAGILFYQGLKGLTF